MDILTLTLVDAIFRNRGVRQAARAEGRSPSTVSSALSRLEAAIAVPLIRRQGTTFILTLEAERRAPMLAETVASIQALLNMAAPERTEVPQISIEALTRFSVTAHRGSIRGAARSLGIGQPQLTRQLGDLERRLGADLLARTAAGVTLTDTGRALLPHAEAVVTGWETMARAASDRFKRDISTWRLGTVMPLGHESSIARMLSNLTAHWAREQARHPLLISSHTADELMLGLKTRRFDLVVIDHVKIPRDFFWAEISSAPLALVGDTEVMASEPSIPELLRKYPLALPSLQSGIRQEAMRFLEATLGPEAANIPIIEVDSIPVIINLVADHRYISILPQPSLVRLPFSFRHISLAPDHMQRLVLAWRRSGLPDGLIEAVRHSVLTDEATQTGSDPAAELA